MEDFNISTEEALKGMYVDPVAFRRKVVYNRVGSPKNCGGGVLIIKFPDGTIKESRTKNLALRLEGIIRQLMAAKNQKIQDTWIRQLRKGRQPFTYDEILELRIEVKRES